MDNLEEFSGRIFEGEIEKKTESIFDTIIDRFSKISDERKDSIMYHSLSSLIGLTSLNLILKLIEKIRSSKPKEYESAKKVIQKIGFKDPLSLSLSPNGLSLIKKHESLKLKAYKIGDGKITIGYGHAEDIGKSKYKVGQKITPEQAVELLRRDIKNAEDGVKRIFKEWKLKNINIHVTQDMFDSLVSMAFNMGISNLRQSQMIQDLKKGKYKKAGELIKKTNIEDDFPGLESRRNEESRLFLSFINKDMGQIS